MINVKCLKGTREKYMLIKDNIYVAEEQQSPNWLLVKCEDGIKRNFIRNRFYIVD